MKKIFLLLFVLSFAFAKAQSVNNYKYVIVDNIYSFQSEANQYRLNELMVFLLEKNGFETFLSNDVLPTDMNKGFCNTLYLKVTAESFLRVAMEASLNDCAGTKVLEFPKGIGRTKDNKKAYYEATRDAFQILESLNYTYQDPYDENVIASNNTVNQENGLKIDSSVATSSKPSMDYLENGGTSFSIKFDETNDNFEFFKYGRLIGSGRKSASGVYLVNTEAFTGIGFIEDDFFVIEYDKGGQPAKIRMAKVN